MVTDSVLVRVAHRVAEQPEKREMTGGAEIQSRKTLNWSLLKPIIYQMQQVYIQIGI